MNLTLPAFITLGMPDGATLEIELAKVDRVIVARVGGGVLMEIDGRDVRDMALDILRAEPQLAVDPQLARPVATYLLAILTAFAVGGSSPSDGERPDPPVSPDQAAQTGPADKSTEKP